MSKAFPKDKRMWLPPRSAPGGRVVPLLPLPPPVATWGSTLVALGPTATDFIILGSKTTVDGDYSHEIKRHLLLGKVMTNLDKVFKISLCQQRFV